MICLKTVLMKTYTFTMLLHPLSNVSLTDIKRYFLSFKRSAQVWLTTLKGFFKCVDFKSRKIIIFWNQKIYETILQIGLPFILLNWKKEDYMRAWLNSKCLAESIILKMHKCTINNKWLLNIWKKWELSKTKQRLKCAKCHLQVM